MKKNEMRKKTTGELTTELLKLFREQLNLRMQRASGQPQQTHLLKLARRNIARVKTLLTEKASTE